MKAPYIGESLPRYDARDKVTGKALYPADINLEGQLFMKILFARRPHARVVEIDTRAALEVPGVVAIFTAADVPCNEYGLQYPDQPVLCGPGSDRPGADIVRFVGDQVAAIVAETEEAAAQARDRIRVVYEELPVLSDPREAIKPDAPRLHPPHERTPVHPELVFEGNIVSHHRIRRGDIAVGYDEAELIIESTYEIPGQEHAYLQPEAGLAYIDEQGRVTVIVAGQWTHEDQHQIAHALALPPEQVRVIYPAIGGAFGGREDMSVQIVLALAAWKLKRPVKIVWTREESIIGHHKRHSCYVHTRWGATGDGKLVFAETEVIADAGAYIYTTNKVLGNLLLTCNGPYRIPHVKTDVYGVYTNNIPAGAFRGFGAPQGNFIAEAQMNKLAAALGMDPVALRLKNLVREGDPMPWGNPLPEAPYGLEDCLIKVAEALGWERNAYGGWIAPRPDPAPDDPPYLSRGIGLAVGFKNIGFSFGYQENAWAAIELYGKGEIERAIVYAASSDVGQGTRTVIRQMAAAALGIPIERVELGPMDTAVTGSSGSCSASRMTFMIGNAIRGAAQAALAKWQDEERPARAEYTYLAPKTTKIDPETGAGDPNFAYGYVAAGMEVVVNNRTGEVRIPRVACAVDVGQAINPRLVTGQIEGGVIQALGWATTEHFIQRDGIPLTTTLSTYLIPTIADIPDEMQSILVENENEEGPWGARGMAEMPFIVVASAMHGALYKATQLWYDSFPYKAQRILAPMRGVEE